MFNASLVNYMNGTSSFYWKFFFPLSDLVIELENLQSSGKNLAARKVLIKLQKC